MNNKEVYMAMMEYLDPAGSSVEDPHVHKIKRALDRFERTCISGRDRE